MAAGSGAVFNEVLELSILTEKFQSQLAEVEALYSASLARMNQAGANIGGTTTFAEPINAAVKGIVEQFAKMTTTIENDFNRVGKAADAAAGHILDLASSVAVINDAAAGSGAIPKQVEKEQTTAAEIKSIHAQEVAEYEAFNAKRAAVSQQVASSLERVAAEVKASQLISEVHAQGLLSDEEYVAKRAAILNQPIEQIQRVEAEASLLVRINELHAQELLSDEEFAAKRAFILSGGLSNSQLQRLEAEAIALIRINEIHAQSLLSDEEYAAKRAAIFNQPIGQIKQVEAEASALVRINELHAQALIEDQLWNDKRLANIKATDEKVAAELESINLRIAEYKAKIADISVSPVKRDIFRADVANLELLAANREAAIRSDAAGTTGFARVEAQTAALARIKELHAQELITDEEFVDKQKAIIGQPIAQIQRVEAESSALARIRDIHVQALAEEQAFVSKRAAIAREVPAVPIIQAPTVVGSEQANAERVAAEQAVLAKINQLHSQELLSDEEFATKRNAIVDQPTSQIQRIDAEVSVLARIREVHAQALLEDAEFNAKRAAIDSNIVVSNERVAYEARVLEQLRALHNQELLSDEEYAAKRAAIIGKSVSQIQQIDAETSAAARIQEIHAQILSGDDEWVAKRQAIINKPIVQGTEISELEQNKAVHQELLALDEEWIAKRQVLLSKPIVHGVELSSIEQLKAMHQEILAEDQSWVAKRQAILDKPLVLGPEASSLEQVKAQHQLILNEDAEWKAKRQAILSNVQGIENTVRPWYQLEQIQVAHQEVLDLDKEWIAKRQAILSKPITQGTEIGALEQTKTIHAAILAEDQAWVNKRQAIINKAIVQGPEVNPIEQIKSIHEQVLAEDLEWSNKRQAILDKPVVEKPEVTSIEQVKALHTELLSESFEWSKKRQAILDKPVVQGPEISSFEQVKAVHAQILAEDADWIAKRQAILGAPARSVSANQIEAEVALRTHINEIHAQALVDDELWVAKRNFLLWGDNSGQEQYVAKEAAFQQQVNEIHAQALIEDQAFETKLSELAQQFKPIAEVRAEVEALVQTDINEIHAKALAEDESWVNKRRAIINTNPIGLSTERIEAEVQTQARINALHTQALAEDEIWVAKRSAIVSQVSTSNARVEAALQARINALHTQALVEDQEFVAKKKAIFSQPATDQTATNKAKLLEQTKAIHAEILAEDQAFVAKRAAILKEVPAVQSPINITGSERLFASIESAINKIIEKFAQMAEVVHSNFTKVAESADTAARHILQLALSVDKVSQATRAAQSVSAATSPAAIAAAQAKIVEGDAQIVAGKAKITEAATIETNTILEGQAKIIAGQAKLIATDKFGAPLPNSNVQSTAANDAMLAGQAKIAEAAAVTDTTIVKGNAEIVAGQVKVLEGQAAIMASQIKNAETATVASQAIIAGDAKIIVTKAEVEKATIAANEAGLAGQEKILAAQAKRAAGEVQIAAGQAEAAKATEAQNVAILEGQAKILRGKFLILSGEDQKLKGADRIAEGKDGSLAIAAGEEKIAAGQAKIAAGEMQIAEAATVSANTITEGQAQIAVGQAKITAAISGTQAEEQKLGVIQSRAAADDAARTAKAQAEIQKRGAMVSKAEADDARLHAKTQSELKAQDSETTAQFDAQHQKKQQVVAKFESTITKEHAESQAQLRKTDSETTAQFDREYQSRMQVVRKLEAELLKLQARQQNPVIPGGRSGPNADFGTRFEAALNRAEARLPAFAVVMAGYAAAFYLIMAPIHFIEEGLKNLEERSSVFQDVRQKLSELYSVFATVAAQPVFDVIVEAAKELSKWLEDNKEWITQVSYALGQLGADAFKAVLELTKLETIKSIVKELVLVLAAAVSGVTQLINAAKLIDELANPDVETPKQVASRQGKDLWEAWRPDKLKEGVTSVSGFTKEVKALGQSIKDSLSAFGETKQVKEGGDAFKTFGENVKKTQEDYDKAVDAINGKVVNPEVTTAGVEARQKIPLPKNVLSEFREEYLKEKAKYDKLLGEIDLQVSGREISKNEALAKATPILNEQAIALENLKKKYEDLAAISVKNAASDKGVFRPLTKADEQQINGMVTSIERAGSAQGNAEERIDRERLKYQRAAAEESFEIRRTYANEQLRLEEENYQIRLTKLKDWLKQNLTEENINAAEKEKIDIAWQRHLTEFADLEAQKRKVSLTGNEYAQIQVKEMQSTQQLEKALTAATDEGIADRNTLIIKAGNAEIALLNRQYTDEVSLLKKSVQERHITHAAAVEQEIALEQDRYAKIVAIREKSPGFKTEAGQEAAKAQDEAHLDRMKGLYADEANGARVDTDELIKLAEARSRATQSIIAEQIELAKLTNNKLREGQLTREAIDLKIKEARVIEDVKKAQLAAERIEHPGSPEIAILEAEIRAKENEILVLKGQRVRSFNAGAIDDVLRITRTRQLETEINKTIIARKAELAIQIKSAEAEAEVLKLRIQNNTSGSTEEVAKLQKQLDDANAEIARLKAEQTATQPSSTTTVGGSIEHDLGIDQIKAALDEITKRYNGLKDKLDEQGTAYDNNLTASQRLSEAFEKTAGIIGGITGAIKNIAGEVHKYQDEFKKNAAAGIGYALGPDSPTGKLIGKIPIAGPIINAVGGMVQAIGDLFGNSIKKIVDAIDKKVKEIQQQASLGNITLQQEIQQLQAEKQKAIQDLGGSKKKGAKDELNKILDTLNFQIDELKKQQRDIIENFNEAVRAASLGTSVMSDWFKTWQGINAQVKTYIDAGGSLATAAQFLNQQLTQQRQNLQDQINQGQQTAIQDAIHLNDLLQQRVQMMKDELATEFSLLNADSLERRVSSAVTIGLQLQKQRADYAKNLQNVNNEISLTQQKVDAEGKIWDLNKSVADLQKESNALTLQSLDQQIAKYEDMYTLLANTKNLIYGTNLPTNAGAIFGIPGEPTVSGPTPGTPGYNSGSSQNLAVPTEAQVKAWLIGSGQYNLGIFTDEYAQLIEKLIQAGKGWNGMTAQQLIATIDAYTANQSPNYNPTGATATTSSTSTAQPVGTGGTIIAQPYTGATTAQYGAATYGGFTQPATGVQFTQLYNFLINIDTKILAGIQQIYTYLSTTDNAIGMKLESEVQQIYDYLTSKFIKSPVPIQPTPIPIGGPINISQPLVQSTGLTAQQLLATIKPPSAAVAGQTIYNDSPVINGGVVINITADGRIGTLKPVGIKTVDSLLDSINRQFRSGQSSF